MPFPYPYGTGVIPPTPWIGSNIIPAIFPPIADDWNAYYAFFNNKLVSLITPLYWDGHDNF